MVRRTLKSVSKSTKAKPGKFVEPGAQHAVREVGPVTYGANSKPALPHERRSVPATQAKNRFGEILQTARESGPVFIERHGQAQAVVLGIETYNKLVSNERNSQERELDYWTREFDALHARMQTHQAREAVDALFSATDAQLNRSGS